MDNSKLNNNLNFNEEESFDYKELVGKIISNWYIFVISVIVCVLFSIFFIREATPDYKITSKVLVQDEKSNTGGMSTNMMTDFSSLFDLPSNAQNEIDILKSRALMEKVVDQMHLNVTIYKKGRFKSDELFDNAPFDVNVTVKTDTIIPKIYNIELLGNGKIHLSNSDDNLDRVVNFGDSVKVGQFVLNITRNTIFKDHPGLFQLEIVSRDTKVEQLSKSLDAQLSDKQSTTIDLTLTYPVAGKGEVILQSLMANYLKGNLDNKVETADSTVAFINRRLVIVQKELEGVENDFAGFKRDNDIADVEEQSKALVASSSDYFNQLNVQEIQLSVINDLEKNIKDPANKTIIPSSLTDQDPVFADAIGKYNDLLLERDKLNMSYKEDNPVVQSLDSQISNVKENLIKSFEAYKKGLQVSKNELQNRSNTFTQQIKSVPGKEKVFLDYSRQQNLKEELYLYLLQKKEETMISKTSTISSARIIDNAKSEELPYKPNKNLIHVIGLALGLLLPLAFLYIKESLNLRIALKQDIEKATKVPIVAEIGNNETQANLVAVENSRSIISEQFRALRTNLQFLIKQTGPQVIMFTSSMSGEGKTFISLNLGSSLAMTGKKIIFLELDLRKPKLSGNLGMSNEFGFTNYIVSDKVDVEEFIKPSYFSENCFIMSSGPIPPNPAELLLYDKVETLMTQLKKKFDFIIIDSPPVGLVADSLVLEKFVDLTIYVVRQNYTFKSQLDIVNRLISEEKLKRVYLVVNDIQSKKAGYYGYGNGYGYGYGYGNYGQETKKKTLLTKFNDKS